LLVVEHRRVRSPSPERNAPVPRTPVTIRFSEECWEFLQGVRSEAPSPLRDDVRRLLERAPWVVLVLPESPRIFEIHTLRLHVWELMTYVGLAARALSPDDPRYRLCTQCLEEMDEGLHRSGTA
jgi:hypothetical protein